MSTGTLAQTSNHKPQRLAQVSAILLDSIGPRIQSAEQSDDAISAHAWILIFEKEAPDHKRVHSRTKKCAGGVRPGANDGIASKIERSLSRSPRKFEVITYAQKMASTEQTRWRGGGAYALEGSIIGIGNGAHRKIYTDTGLLIKPCEGPAPRARFFSTCRLRDCRSRGKQKFL